MANLFLGFPVSRARFADLAASALTSLYEATDFYYNTFFESLEGWEPFTNSPGTVTLDVDKVGLSTGIGSGGIAGILTRLAYPPVPLTWAKRRRFRLKAKVDVASDASSQVFIATGDEASNQYGFGFRFTNDKVRGFSQNGGAPAYADLVTGLTAPYSRTELYEIDFTPGVRIEFYIDGVLKGTVTTGLPTGTTKADRLMRMIVYASTTALHQIFTSGIQVSQDA